jgi:hypothetical protein
MISPAWACATGLFGAATPAASAFGAAPAVSLFGAAAPATSAFGATTATPAFGATPAAAAPGKLNLSHG